MLLLALIFFFFFRFDVDNGSSTQYFNASNIVRVDWGRVSQKFENLFYTVDPNGIRRPPRIQSLWNWLVDFLTADFQPRATFLAGLLLGLRIG